MTSRYPRAATLDPWWDTARRGWREALAKIGDRNAALQVYREYAALLREDPNAAPDEQTAAPDEQTAAPDEQTAAPDEQTAALYARLRAEACQQANTHAVVAAENAAAPKVTGYLPYALTDLVGREDERMEVADRLQYARLVTLTGLGGIGKTKHRDWFVALSERGRSRITGSGRCGQ